MPLRSTLRPCRRLLPLLVLTLALVASVACSSGSNDATPAPAGAAASASGGTLYIGGIPDQDPARIERIFTLTAAYLSKRTGLDVKFAPSTDYAAIVSAFQRGDVALAWFGGLTGVQARELVPDSRALVQRPRDAQFHSVFIVGPGVTAQSLADLKGRSFTFGSESSTSGHLMPRYYLSQAGIDADHDFSGPPGYSGSHDRTYALVESGAYQAGALNEAVWQSAVGGGKVDTTKVRVLETTPAYFDYNWSIRPDVDARYGAGATEQLHRALLDLNASMGADESELLTLFATDRFVDTMNENYDAIRAVAEGLGILR